MTPRLGPLGRVICAVYVAAIGIPLFILPGHRTTNLTIIWNKSAPASLDPQPLRIHWIVCFVAVVIGYFAVTMLREKRVYLPPRTLLVAGLILVFFMALVTGLVLSPGYLNVIYFIQTVVPILGFVVGAHLADSAKGLRTISLSLVAATTASLICIYLLARSYGAFSSDFTASSRLGQSIPQLRDYFPYVVAASLSLALGLWSSSSGIRNKVLLAMAIVIHVLFCSLAWSRMGLVMLGVVVVSPLLFATRSERKAVLVRRLAMAVGLLTIVGIVVTLFGPVAMRWRARGFERSDSRRIEYAVTATRMIAETPIFGRMFIADWERDPSPARDLRVPRIFKAHNQYLDYGVRAGLPAMVLLGIIAWGVGKDLRSALRRSSSEPGLRPMLVGVTGALVALVLGNFTQLLLVQAQSGSLAWLLVGVAVSTRDLPS